MDPSNARPANDAAEPSTGRKHSLLAFWQRVTEGLELAQLWGQFASETRATYGLFSKEVDWQRLQQEKGFKRWLVIAWELFQAMLMKLSPARRVALLIAIVLLVIGGEWRIGNTRISFEWQGIGVLLLFLLLALELADRVTMKRDLEIARDIQRWLVPATPPAVSGLDLAFTTRPANTVAGDYYDAFVRPASATLDAGRLLVVVADVAGKSVPAALLMATFQASLRALAAAPGKIEDVVAGLDRYAAAHSLGGLRFTTAFLAEYDASGRALTSVNAGHNAPILCRASGEIRRLEAGGLPFGVAIEGKSRGYASETTQLQAGDVLVVFTDGVIEAVNLAGEEYGEERLLAQVRAKSNGSAQSLLDAMIADVDHFVSGARQHDDITCLVMRIESR